MRYYQGYKGLVVCTFKSGCAGNYTSSYLDLPDANLVSIDFRRNNSLYSSNNLHLFKRLGIINNLHWAEYHAVIYRLLLNPSEGVQNSVQTVLSQFPTKWFTVAAHIRCAGKIANYKEGTVMVGERQLPSIAEKIRALLKVYSGESNQTLFIATDSSYALEYLSQALYPIQVLSNNQVVRGHSTGTKQLIVHSTLTDLFLLTRSEAFIGVHKSSLSRVTAALSCPKKVKWFDYQEKSHHKLKKVNTTKLVKLILCCYVTKWVGTRIRVRFWLRILGDAANLLIIVQIDMKEYEQNHNKMDFTFSTVPKKSTICYRTFFHILQAGNNLKI